MLIPIVMAIQVAVTPQAAIEAGLRDAAAAWNRGDLATFMALYADDAVFVGGGKLVSGKAAIATHYGKTAGKLTVQPLGWRALSQVHVVLFARWTLEDAGKSSTGMTTLVFERRRAGWRIISDHSS